MSPFRSALALCALGLCAAATTAQGATPAVSTVVAFSISNSSGNLVRGGDGALYGVVVPTTSIAGGLIYRATTDGSDVRTLYQMSPTNDAISPQAGLILGSDGMLYGTTRFGRGNELGGTGTVFKVSQTGTGFTIVHRFATATTSNANLSPQNTDGAYPESELTEGTDTYLYGVTTAGGPNGTGAVFRVSRDGTDFDLLHAFAADTDTTTSGLVVTVDGAAPLGPLVQGADGYLYGTTSAGGTFGRGTIFRVAIDGTGFQVLKHFSATTTDTTTGLAENVGGAIPVAGLTDGNDGLFYGVTSIGGTTGQGVVFSISPAGLYTVLHEFDGNAGQRPAAELLLGSDGKLYGTTFAGGVTSGGQASTLGTMYSLDRAGTNFTRLHSFSNDAGAQPASKLVQLGADTFVGTLQAGGKCGFGAIYLYSGAGNTVAGNTRCGRRGNNSNSGGGSADLALLALLGALGACALRRRTPG